MSTIMLRSSNFDGKSTFTYQIPQSLDLTNHEIALHSYSFYNSFFNIGAAQGNNQIRLSVPMFSQSVANQYIMSNYDFTIPDGFYSYSSLNYFLQQCCIVSKLYLKNPTTGQYFYPVQILQNGTQYSVNIMTYYIPSASQLAGLGFGPDGTNCAFMFNIATTDILQVGCTVTIPSTGLATMLGYQVGTYPATEPKLTSNTYQTSAAYTAGSTDSPQVNSVIAVCLRCSVVNNMNSIPSDFIANIPILSSFGALTQFQPAQLLWLDCIKQKVNQITITLYDQNFNTLIQRDND